MAILDIRDELDMLSLDVDGNGINGHPYMENINGWYVTKSANGRRVARKEIDVNISNYVELGELRKGTSNFCTVFMTLSTEENLPIGVFTDIPESISCEWRNVEDRVVFIDTTRTTVNMTTTGKHRAIMINTIEQTVLPTTVLVEWVVAGY